MVRQALTTGTELRELDRLHPVLQPLDRLATFHWESAAFLDLCAIMGLMLSCEHQRTLVSASLTRSCLCSPCCALPATPHRLPTSH